MTIAEGNSGNGDQPLPADLRQIHDNFLSAGRAGVRVTMAPFLEAVSPSNRPILVRELLSTDILFRRERGDTLPAEEYRAEFPQYSEIIDDLLSETCNGENCGPECATRQMETAAWAKANRKQSRTGLPQVPGYELVRVIGKGAWESAAKRFTRAADRLVAVLDLAFFPRLPAWPVSDKPERYAML